MRIIIGIIAMVVLFIGFLIAFITIQRKKTEYHQNIQALLEEEQKLLARQNQELERKVNERTDQINKQKEELEDSLIELKKTQQILIQTEKMASLGEVTSGIAHEIQNPLNFINNFSDVSVEMFEEMMDAYRKGDKDEIRELANEILDNLKKIHYHGKRADAIVKSMQAHTRVGSGKREFVDLNQIIKGGIDFLLNTPKYKDLLATEQIEFSPNPDVKPLWIIPQDISRVIESTLSNAAYWTLKK